MIKILEGAHWALTHPVQTVLWLAIGLALLYVLAAITFAILSARDELKGYRDAERAEGDLHASRRTRAAGIGSRRDRVDVRELQG